MKNAPRHIEVDLLRGLAMAGMILIHTSAYFLSNRVASFVWDTSQFAVVAFIFCSSYVFFQRARSQKNHSFQNYIKKRVKRLLLPYYFFLVLILTLVYLGEPQKITTLYILQNIFVVEGMAINWLVLLFLQLSIILPFVPWLFQKNRWLFYGFVFASLGSSGVFLFVHPLNYRIIMWLPWSLVVVFTWYFISYEKSRRFFAFGFLISGFLFLVLRFLLQTQHRSLTMFDNKYPPNLYHLVYGFFAVFFLWWIFRRGVFNFFPIKNMLTFLSLHSYPIFFIHYAVIYVLTVFYRIRLNWVVFFILVFFITMMVQLLLVQIRHLFSKAKSGPTI